MKKQDKIIGIDVDDTICNTLELDRAYGIYYAQKNGIQLSKEMLDSQDFYIPRAYNFTKEQELDFFLKEKNFIMKNTYMFPKVFVKEVLAKLKEKGFKVYLITSRDNIYWNGNAKKYAQKWLRKYKIKYDKVFANIKNKAELCKSLNIEIMVDDNPEFVKQLNENNIKTAIIKQGHNKGYTHKNNIMAESWLDLYVKLGKIYNFSTDDIIDWKLLKI